MIQRACGISATRANEGPDLGTQLSDFCAAAEEVPEGKRRFSLYSFLRTATASLTLDRKSVV